MKSIISCINFLSINFSHIFIKIMTSGNELSKINEECQKTSEEVDLQRCLLM